jgi:hypothetical protein
MNNRVGEILDRPTCNVEEYRQIVPGSRNATYDAIKRGEIPSIRVGRRIHVLTAPLKAKLGLGPLPPNTVPGDAPRDLLRGA